MAIAIIIAIIIIIITITVFKWPLPSSSSSSSSSSLSSSSSSSSSSSPSSSSSSSTSKSSYAYDVFLSFRGETRYKFTDHLYNDLVNKGFHTFRDKEGARKGKSLKPELEKAIKQSRVSIVVLSENYSSSTWCLDELVMILDRMKTSEHEVLPVFYHVTPSEVRKQEETIKALARHEKEHPELKEKLKRWKAALEEVGHLIGIPARGYESVLIQDITKWVGNRVIHKHFYLPNLIGMDTRAKNIIKWLQDDSSEFNSGGICGMGGIGKTTIAQFVYNVNYQSFDAHCFIAEVREMSKQPNGLVKLQRQLLSCIANEQRKKIYSVNEGRGMIMEAVSRKRVLLVLDDVDDIDQLDALCGNEDWSCRGSKIIITTRDENLLKRCKVFKVEELGHDQSVELFCSHAFRENSSTEDYEEHILRVVQLCGGLPLALKVIGSTLYERSVRQWASLVKKLEDIPHKKILDKLEISYDCLEDDSDKRVFLDIACFYVGYDTSYTIKVLDGTPNTHADVGIQNLIARNLLSIDSCNKLMMHQLVRDMGRNIVRQESPEEHGAGERSRLWCYKVAHNVIQNMMGTRKITGLTLDMLMLKEDGDTLTDLRTNAFEKMENLRLLKLNYTHLTGCYDNFPKKLVWLCWHGFPLKSLPVELSLKSLIALDLSHSKLEEVWADCTNLKSLKILDLSYSASLVKTPDFLGVPKLEKLILKGCVSLIDCESIEILQKLVLLDLTYCENLRKLPNNMHNLRSLETLIADRSNLFAGGHEISATQPGRGPEMLWASLPHTLVSLSLVWCNLSDDSLPCAFSNLSRLKYLNLRVNLFRSLPDCIKSLSSLQWLSLGACDSLDSILGLPSNLQYLDVSDVCVSPLRRITFQSTPDQLIEINTFSCYNLVEIEGILKRESIEKVDRRIIENLGIDIESIKNLKVKRRVTHFGVEPDPIQGIYEFGIFNTFIPGGKIPNFLSERKKGSSISYIVPSVPKFRIQCLNIYSVYVAVLCCYYRWGGIEIINKTKNLTWVYIPMYFGIPEEDREEEYFREEDREEEYFGITEEDRKKEMTWFSQWNFGNQLEGGDEIVVSVLLEDWLEVKECGIKIVYEEEEEEDNGVVTDDNNDKTYFHWNEIVGGDLSQFQLRTGTYFLRRMLYQDEYRLKDMEDEMKLFGDIASLEGTCACLDLYLEFRNQTLDQMQKLKVRCGIQPFLDLIISL